MFFLFFFLIYFNVVIGYLKEKNKIGVALLKVMGKGIDFNLVLFKQLYSKSPENFSRSPSPQDLSFSSLKPFQFSLSCTGVQREQSCNVWLILTWFYVIIFITCYIFICTSIIDAIQNILGWKFSMWTLDWQRDLCCPRHLVVRHLQG